MQPYQNATINAKNQQLIAETAVVLELLAVAMAIIALPGTPAVMSKVLASLAQHTASNWAEMLADSPADAGGAL
jgi:hypothetical protein